MKISVKTMYQFSHAMNMLILAQNGTFFETKKALFKIFNNC